MQSTNYNLLGNVHWLELQRCGCVCVHNYNLLGNVHWLELHIQKQHHYLYYNLLGNVHWLELIVVAITVNNYYNLLGNVHWLELTANAVLKRAHYNLLGNVHWLEIIRLIITGIMPLSPRAKIVLLQCLPTRLLLTYPPYSPISKSVNATPRLCHTVRRMRCFWRSWLSIKLLSVSIP